MSEVPAIAMEDITKIFGEDFKANDSIYLKVRKGSIHALVGENGAGKSTLMNILYGLLSPAFGTIKINGVEKKIRSPREAISLGIGMVHQHFMLAGSLSVLENIILGDETSGIFGRLNLNEITHKINSLIESFKISIDINEKTGNLPVGLQQKVEILKLLYRNAEILILDEPTAVLTPQETDELFNTLKELKAKGKTIILISHKLSEVLSISDNITVLRRGRVTGNLVTSKTNRDEISKLIVGGEFTDTKKIISEKPGRVILRIENLDVLNDKKLLFVNNVSLKVRAGEILGLAGVEGNGQNELIEAICGMRKIKSGRIEVDGEPVKSKTPVSHIPSDRHKYAMVREYDIPRNILLGRQKERMFADLFAIKKETLKKYTENLIKEFDIRPPNADSIIDSLSGGNQQKVVVSRELSKGSSLIIASHPTRGLDIKAAAFVHRALLDQKDKAVLLVSSDLTELLKLSNRIAVIYNGEITGIFDARNANEQQLGLCMTGMKTINN